MKIKKKYDKGNINHNFYKKAIKNAMKNLIKINFFLKENNIFLPDLLKKMNITEKYRTAIDIFNKISSFNSLKQLPKNENHGKDNLNGKLKSSIFELPGITSEITASFITLMDALKLEGFKKNNLIFKLFKDLKIDLEKFPGLNDIISQVKIIEEIAGKNSDELISNQKFREKIVDSLYQVFKDFQYKLNISS
ncbi:MAG: hypothetical protein ACTSQG_02885 [Promethearchaeota archaeon]